MQLSLFDAEVLAHTNPYLAERQSLEPSGNRISNKTVPHQTPEIPSTLYPILALASFSTGIARGNAGQA